MWKNAVIISVQVLFPLIGYSKSELCVAKIESESVTCCLALSSSFFPLLLHLICGSLPFHANSINISGHINFTCSFDTYSPKKNLCFFAAKKHENGFLTKWDNTSKTVEQLIEIVKPKKRKKRKKEGKKHNDLVTVDGSKLVKHYWHCILTSCNSNWIFIRSAWTRNGPTNVLCGISCEIVTQHLHSFTSFCSACLNFGVSSLQSAKEK